MKRTTQIRLACTVARVARAASPKLRAPDGLSVERVTGAPQVRFPAFDAFDERGRLVVTDPPDLATLEGTDGDGRTERPPDDSFVLRKASGAEVGLDKDQIKSALRTNISIMPEGLLAALSQEDFRDLFAYLQSLK